MIACDSCIHCVTDVCSILPLIMYGASFSYKKDWFLPINCINYMLGNKRKEKKGREEKWREDQTRKDNTCYYVISEKDKGMPLLDELPP